MQLDSPSMMLLLGVGNNCRLLAAGSMEEKIFMKQVTKMSLSARVVDAQMPENHFTQKEKTGERKYNKYCD